MANKIKGSWIDISSYWNTDEELTVGQLIQIFGRLMQNFGKDSKIRLKTLRHVDVELSPEKKSKKRRPYVFKLPGKKNRRFVVPRDLIDSMEKFHALDPEATIKDLREMAGMTVIRIPRKNGKRSTR